MKLTRAAISDVIIIEADLQSGEHGFLLETFVDCQPAASELPSTFVQDRHLGAAHGTLRGLHAPRRHPTGKLVRAIEGEIFDVAVDIRRGSPTFGQWVGTWLSADNARQCYIPPGFAHGFCVASATAQVMYRYTHYYDASDEIRLLWNDPEIAITWPVDCPRLSDGDRSALLLRELMRWFPVYDCALEVA